MNPRTAGLLLAAAGLLLLAHPLYAWPHHGETEYAVSLERADSAPPESTVVAAEGLPPAAQRAVETDGAADLWSETDAAPIRALRDADYVRHEGTVYAVAVEHTDRLQSPLRPLTTIFGGLLLGVGGLLALEGRPRPRNPLAAAWVPLAVILALQIVETLDAGRVPVLNVGTNLTGLGILASPLGLGVALRRRDRLGAAAFGALTLLLGVASAVLAWREPQAALLWMATVSVVAAVGAAWAAPRPAQRGLGEWLLDAWSSRVG
ncbi:MAG: hypothetical protein ABEJ42_05515 [Halobacteriaceae archaeon]